MSIKKQSIDSDAQNINWQSVFNYAVDRSLKYEAGDPLPHGGLVDALKHVANADSNSTAARCIRQGVRDDELRQTEQGYEIIHDGPGTGDIRQCLKVQLQKLMRNGANGVIQSPTSSGKTYTPSTTRWRSHPDITGGQPVILFSGTTDARDDALAKSQNSWVATEILKGREDVCPLARGDYDSNNEAGNASISAPDGTEPSDWFKTMCDERGLHISVAHGIFERAFDHDIPCCKNGRCESETQWRDIPRDSDDGEVKYDVLHATHSFGQVPQLIENCNLIIDEQPDFSLNITTGRVRQIVTNYLTEIDAPVENWEDLLSGVTGSYDTDLGQLQDALEEPEIEWFKTDKDAHALSPGIVEAIVTAEKHGNDRWVGKTQYTYPNLNPYHDGPTQEVMIRIVINDKNEINLLQTIPDFSKARCVIGLDAHPTIPKWRGNTIPSIEMKQIVDSDQRHKWRRNQRNLTIVQVGDNKNTWTNNGFHSSKDKVRVLCDKLREIYGEGFRTGIISLRFEDDFRQLLADSGVENPDTIHFGNEKSVEDFDSEQCGLVAGCISPSSDQIKDWLALLDKDATPRREVDDNYQGQKWVGPDADIAEELLADVREKGVLQACGRYARSPQDPTDGAIVYVLTDVLPSAYVDEKIDDVRVFGEKAKQILNYIHLSTDGTTPAEITENVDASRKHVHNTLNLCCDESWMRVEEREGGNTPDVYYADCCPDGLVEM